MMKALNSVGPNPCSHYTTAPLVTNLCSHELALPRRLCPGKRIENTSKNRKNNLELQMNNYLMKVGVLQTECR
jgi:hypothetical protein